MCSTRRVASAAVAATAFLLASASHASAAPPVCVAPPQQSTIESLPLEFVPAAFCEHPDPQTFAVAAPPAHGTVAVDGGVLVYTPVDGYTGSDQFSFTATAGAETSLPVAVAIVVVPNQPPACETPLFLEVEHGQLRFFDPYEYCDDERFVEHFEVVDPPLHGTLGPYETYGFAYVPDPGYQGPDVFTIVARDHLAQSNLVTVNVTVRPPNQAPTCVPSVSARVQMGGTLPLDPGLACTDPDGDILSLIIVSGPVHGLIASFRGELAYLPRALGPDSIDLRVFDHRGGVSNVVRLNIYVDPPVPPPLDRRPPELHVVHLGPARLAAVRRRGLKLLVTSDERGKARIELTVSRRTARRLRIDRRATRSVVVGRVVKPVAVGGNEFAVRLTKRARDRMASARRVAILVAVTIRDIAGNPARQTLQVTLRR